jgi:teichuronic acid biosynthesis glycosyltransferase TuaC
MSNRALKVLFLTSSYPRSPDDTASVFVRYLAEQLADRGLVVYVLAPANGKGGKTVEGRVTVYRFQYFPVALQALAYGSGIMSNLKRSPWLWLQVPFFVLSMAYRLLHLIRKQKPALVHAHWILPQGFIGALAKLILGTPLITTAHGADTFALRGPVSTRIKRFIIAMSDAWTANTPATASAIGPLAALPKPIVIPMGVNIELFAGGNPAKLRALLAENEFLLLFVGRLVEKKGCHNLLQAFSLLPSNLRERTTLWIIGDGDQKSRLEASAKNLGIAHKVRFWGTLPNEQLPDFYAAADLVAAPSVEAASGDTEGQGVVLLEAFAARTCVVTTRVGGIDNVVTDGVTGRVLKPGQPRLIADAVERLLRDATERERLAENAFRKVQRVYGWDRVAAQFETLYRDICDSRQTQP